MMGCPIDPRMHRLLPKGKSPEERRRENEAAAKELGISVQEYLAQLRADGVRLAAEAAKDPMADYL